MQLLLVTNRRLRRGAVQLGFLHIALIAATLVAAVGGTSYLGFRLAPASGDVRAELYESAWRRELIAQRERIAKAIADAENDVNALALQVGELQAHVIRLDALGWRLVEMAKLDADEFQFGAPPARGGPAPSTGAAPALPDFLASLRNLAADLDERAPMLHSVEGALMNRRLDAELVPSGRPVNKGWISSHFGHRLDPITGRTSFHSGVDFAGRRGTDVVAVASGVVAFSGMRQGYGRLVEINHGDGYSTLYAHNSRNVVESGETVRRGEVIALMGASGRATGTHVHFEVLRHGKPVDPLNYIRASKD